jgi:Flp pilus assembly pilin Flp
MQKVDSFFLASLKETVRRLLTDQSAASSIEYAMIASCIAIAILGAVIAVGSEVRDGLFQKVADVLPG